MAETVAKTIAGASVTKPHTAAASEAEIAARLAEALKIARKHVEFSALAEHMLDGFGPRVSQPSDDDLQLVDDALSDYFERPPSGPFTNL